MAALAEEDLLASAEASDAHAGESTALDDSTGEGHAATKPSDYSNEDDEDQTENQDEDPTTESSQPDDIDDAAPEPLDDQTRAYLRGIHAQATIAGLKNPNADLENVKDLTQRIVRSNQMPTDQEVSSIQKSMHDGTRQLPVNPSPLDDTTAGDEDYYDYEANEEAEGQLENAEPLSRAKFSSRLRSARQTVSRSINRAFRSRTVDNGA
jgi:hypothetical protein